jgi:hypothetical protein
MGKPNELYWHLYSIALGAYLSAASGAGVHSGDSMRGSHPSWRLNSEIWTGLMAANVQRATI